MKNIRVCMRTIYESGFKEHPLDLVKSLGVTYKHATPQTMGDQWWLWCCENIPEPLPKYLQILDLTPTECVGFGLSKEQAEWLEKEKKAALIKSAVEKLLRLEDNGDTEDAHLEADYVLCELLNEMGFEQVVEAYEKIHKWYA